MQSLKDFMHSCPKNISDRFQLHEFLPGETIIPPGFCGEYIYILTSGQAKVTSLNSNGEYVTLSLYNKWELLGEVEVFTGIPCEKHIIALGRCKTYSLSKEDFLLWLKKDFNFNSFVFKSLGDKLLRLSATSQICMGGFVRERIAHILLTNLTQNQIFPYNKQVLAESVGVSIRSLNRVLKDLIEDNTITVSDNYIQVNETEKLYTLFEREDND